VQFDLILTPHESVNVNDCATFDFDNADFSAINYALSNHPFNRSIVVAESDEQICFTDTPDSVWSKFVSPLQTALTNFVPTKSRHKTINKKSKKYPRHISRALRRKSDLWRSYKKDKSVENKAKYKGQTALCKKLILDHERSKELNVINKNNLGSFYMVY
jgi:hypothetical protein